MPQAATASTDSGSSSDAPSLEEIRARLSRVTHDLNNPLAVISGNAQYALELARAVEVDADVRSSIEDIEEASQQLRRIIEDLVRLKEEIREAVEADGGAPERAASGGAE